MLLTYCWNICIEPHKILLKDLSYTRVRGQKVWNFSLFQPNKNLTNGPVKTPFVLQYCSLGICVRFSDVDECSASSPVCASNANCSNTRGSYVCTCKSGYTGDGKACQGRIENVSLTQRVRDVFLYTNQIKNLTNGPVKTPFVVPTLQFRDMCSFFRCWRMQCFFSCVSQQCQLLQYSWIVYLYLQVRIYRRWKSMPR